MTKNKFAGLAEAKMKSLEAETGGADEEKAVEADKQEKKKSIKLANKSSSKLVSKQAAKLARGNREGSGSLVGVTIKIPEEKRIWWNVQAKLQRTTLTDAIIEALDKRFGEPKFE